MDKPRGGRGHTAPYETKQMRVPTGLESQVQELISRYRDWISEAGTRIAGASNPPVLLDKSSNISIQQPVDKLKDEVENLVKLVDNLRADNVSLTKERDALDLEINQLHAQNGELNLQVLELKEHLKLVDKLNKLAVGSTDKPVDKISSPTTNSANKPVDKIDKPATNLGNKPVDKINDSKLEPMTQRQLAKRLNTSHTTVGRHRVRENFASWSRDRDPDQASWRFDPKLELFYPVDC